MSWSIALVLIVVVLCVSALVAWRMWLIHDQPPLVIEEIEHEEPTADVEAVES